MMRFVKLWYAASVIACISHSQHLRSEDRTRLTEAFRLAENFQNRVWQNWSAAPFPVDLVSGDYELLMRHPKPTSDFIFFSYDSTLKSEVYFRKRQFPPDFLATFPLGGVPTLVVGQSEKTNVPNSTAWIVTVLHEHFHQLQYSQPDYYSATASLNLSRGDQTGMWMLNYPFPYDSTPVADKFSALCKLLSQALDAPDSEFRNNLGKYLSAREEFRKILSDDNYKYFSFQIWQEGIARYTEYRIARLASDSYSPSVETRSLPDFRPLSSIADSLHDTIRRNLTNLSFPLLKRVAFYTFGAAEGMLLDRANPRWQERYFRDKFFLGKYYQP